MVSVLDDSFEAGARRPLTILQVTPELNVGGVERGTLEIAQAIVNAGGRALVASAGGRLASRLRSVGAELFEAPLATKNPFTIRANVERLSQIIRDEQVDILHARSRAPAWSGYWACEATGALFMTTYHGAYSEGLPFKRVYNSVMAKGARVVAISRYIAELIASRHGRPPGTIDIIPRGADVSLFAEENVKSTRMVALAERWGVAEDLRPLLMLPGRLTRWKGQTLFLEALDLLRRKRGAEDFSAVIVGGDGVPKRQQAPGAAPPPLTKFGAEVSRIIERRGLGHCVRLVGHCDDMPAALRLASFAVSASLEPEAFGRVAVEAQAMGVPVIAAAHGGAKETIDDGVTGWLFEPRDAGALAAAMDHALSISVEERRRMARAAVERVRARYTIEAMQLATLQVYQELAGRRF